MPSSKKSRKQEERRKRMRQFYTMLNKLNEMQRSMGEVPINNNSSVLKLDEFEKLRRHFTASAEDYEKANKEIKSMSDRVVRAQLMFKVITSEKEMEDSLKQMVALASKLKHKVEKEQVRGGKAHGADLGTPSKRQRPEREGADEESLVEEKTPLENQLEYKNLVVFNIQRIYFKLIASERKEVEATKREVRQNKYASLEELKNEAANRKLIGEDEESMGEVERLEEKEILEAIQQLDEEIQSKMDNILQGVNVMHYNALSISEGLDQVHRKIIVNRGLVDHNQLKLNSAQQMLDQVTPHARKPSCICNVVLIVLMALVTYLLLRILVFDEQSNQDSLPSLKMLRTEGLD